MPNRKVLSDSVSKIDHLLPLFVVVICVLQPLMDVISFWLVEMLGTGNGLTSALRMLVFVVVALVGFLLSRKKWIYYIAAALCVVLWAGHIWICRSYGYLSPISDAANYIRILQMPVYTVCFISLMKRNEKCFDALKSGFVANFIIITIVFVISVITGTSKATYVLNNIGIIGWFSNTNSQSAIVSILSPIVLLIAYESKHKWLVWPVSIAATLQLYFIGTRLAFVAIAATMLGIIFIVLVTGRFNWKQVIPLILCLVVSCGCYKLSPMYRNQHMFTYHVNAVQGDASDMVQQGIEEIMEGHGDDPDDSNNSDGSKPLTFAELTPAEKIEALTALYEYRLTDLCGRFGIEKVAPAYDYSYEVSKLSNIRFRKITFCKLLMDEYPSAAKLFGMELAQMTYNDVIFDVENDFHGVFFLTGAMGLALIILFILFFLALIAKALIKDIKKYFTPTAGAFGIALIIALVNAYCTAGVLRRPNSSFYLSVVLAAIYFLVEIKKYPDANENIHTEGTNA